MTIKFICEYNGKDFHGFQRQGRSQKSAPLRTVQSVLEDSLSKYFGESIKIAASGRTDAGVHSKGQVCSFTTNKTVPTDQLFKLNTAINAFLPPDVSVHGFEIMPDDFHAQFSAKAKTYIYKCYINPHRSALRSGTHLQLFKNPDLNAMKAAAKNFTGTQSFKDFTTDKSDTKNFIRTVYSFDVTGTGQNNDEIVFTVRGDGFMRNMVRIMCGRVLDIGYGKTSPKTNTLPAHGLILESVEY